MWGVMGCCGYGFLVLELGRARGGSVPRNGARLRAGCSGSGEFEPNTTKSGGEKRGAAAAHRGEVAGEFGEVEEAGGGEDGARRGG